MVSVTELLATLDPGNQEKGNPEALSSQSARACSVGFSQQALDHRETLLGEVCNPHCGYSSVEYFTIVVTEDTEVRGRIEESA